MTTHKAPEAIGIKTILTNDLHPNPHNPRMLFDRLPLETLKQSIDKVGILVPLTVYWDAKNNYYVILDGQRRWICAKELKKREVPVNQVAEPSLVQNIVTMFQIHKLREDWELMPTALKLELLMNELKERSDKKLAELTGLNQAVVIRCKKLLSFPKIYQELMLDPNSEKRVKPDFFIEFYPIAADTVVKKIPGYSKDGLTKQMLEKYKEGGLKSVTDFRIVKQHISNAQKAGKTNEIAKRFKEFADNPKLTVEHLEIKSVNVSAITRRLLRDVENLYETIKNLDVEEFYGEEKLWSDLQKLINVIQAKLISANRRVK
jgi:ParB/RepB/Spo0J family partition protein